MASRRLARRPAITRIELVVLVVVILTALGIVLALLPQAHEGSHHVVCSNNLARIGKAIHAYHKEANALPAGRIDAGYATWAVQIAPLLSKQKENPPEAYDLTKPYYDQSAAVRGTYVPEFFCPARRRPWLTSQSGDVPSGKPNAEHVPGALGDYGCASSDGNPKHPWDTLRANGAIIPAEVLQREGTRIVRWRSLTTLQELEAARGTSNTILVGEKHVARDDFGQASQGDGSIYNGDYPASFARIGGPGHGLAKSPTDRFNANFGSYHMGICHFLMADGSVKTLATTIPDDVLGRLIVRHREKEQP